MAAVRLAVAIAHLSGCGENPGAAFDIISDGGEADLQTRLCEPSPAHASKAVASLPRSEDFFDAATNAVDRPVPSPKTRQRFRLVSTPHAGRSDAQAAALGLDGLAKSLSPIRAVGEYLAWLVRQGQRSGFAIVLTFAGVIAISSTRAVSASAPTSAVKPKTAARPLCLTQRASSSPSLAEAMMVASTSVPVLTRIALALSWVAISSNSALSRS